MMQVELLESWPSEEEIGLYFADEDAQENSFQDFSDDSHTDFLIYGDEDSPVLFPMEQCLLSNSEEIDIDTSFNDQLMFDELEGLCDPSSQHLSPISSEACIDVSSSLCLPSEDMDIHDQLSIYHPLKAYGEAMELEQRYLAKEIIRKLEEKACPTGTTLERVAYYLIKALEEERKVDYLNQESIKNHEAAFRAFYQMYPYGRFAHFTANSAILDAIPEDAKVVHIVDFDIGSGIQWPSLIEELGRRGGFSLRLTSIKHEEEEDCCICFEDTKNRLVEHARFSGLWLKVEEMDMEGLVSEMKRGKKRGGSNEWLAFNCMVGLPHMRRMKSILPVIEFLNVAKSTSRGIITFGNVSEVEKSSGGFESLFEGKLIQLQAFFESMELHFPAHLTDARIAIESLFMAPQVSSSLVGSRKWDVPEIVGLEGCRMSKDNVMEAKEMVREGESLYWVRTEGKNENQMVLGFMGTPLVSVSRWR